MQKNRKTIIILTTTLASVLLLTAAGVAAFLWHLPHFWLDKLQNDYLLQHRNILRAKNIQPGAFNKFILHDVQIGSSEKPLFTAPRAELLLKPDYKTRLTALPIQSMILYDCRTEIDTAGKKIYVNGILLEKLVKNLSAIPAASSSGKPLTLIINSELSFGSKKPTARLQFIIRKSDEKLNIQGSWSALANKNASGSWHAFIDLQNDTLSVTTENIVTEIFMQEILLRAGVTARAAAIFHKGVFSGTGSFSGSFSDLKINELICNGKIEKPVLAFYKHKIKNADPFEVKIEKNSRGVSCKISQFSLNNKVILKEISINFRKKITFTAYCNFQQLSANCFFRHNVKIKSDPALQDKLHGSWDTANNIWQFSKISAPAAENRMQLEIADSTFALQVEKFDFKAQGKGSAGTVTQELKFKNLEVYTPDNQKKIQISKGSVNAKTLFGADQHSEQHISGISGSDFSAKTDWGFVELPIFSASAEMRAAPGNILDAFVSFSGPKGKATSNNGLISAIDWRGFFRMSFDLSKQLCSVKTLDFKSADLKLEYNKKHFNIPQAHIHLSGSFKQKRPVTAIIEASSDKVFTDQMNIVQAKLKIDYDSQRQPGEMLKISGNAARGDFPLSDSWFISKVTNADVALTSSDWQSIPHKIALQAEILNWDKAGFSGVFQNSKWQISQKKDRSWDCNADFDYLRMQSKNHKFGSSQMGKSTLFANLTADGKGSCEKLKISGIMEQVSWQKSDYHSGSESMQCDLQFNKAATPHLQGSITMNNANILGPHITASTPVLHSKFTASDTGDISGHIDFAPGSISNQSGEIELRKAKFKLPLQISTHTPKLQNAGELTAGDVFYKQKREGSFSGKIRHFMRLPASVTDTLAHQIEIDGVFLADKFNKAPVKMNSIWQLPPEKSSSQWQFSMPESKLVQPLILSEYLALPVNCAAFRGNFTLSGNIKLISGQPDTSVIKLNTINTDWQFGEITAQGVTAASVLTLANNKYSLMPHDVSIGKILWKNWELLDNELNLSLNHEGKLQAANYQASLMGGKVISTQIPAIDVNDLAKPVPMKFTLEDIPLTVFFNKFGIKSFISDAKLAGDILLHASKQGIQVENSTLYFKSPIGKKLQLNLDKPEDLKMRDIHFKEFTIAVLKAMKCYQANFNFSTAPGEVSMLVKAEGVPAEPVPFVYQGRSGNTPFRAAEPGERGFAGEIELNVNLKLHPDEPGSLN